MEEESNLLLDEWGNRSQSDDSDSFSEDDDDVENIEVSYYSLIINLVWYNENTQNNY